MKIKYITGLIIIISCLLHCKRQDDLYNLNGTNGLHLGAIISVGSITSMVADADSSTVITISIQVNPGADTNLNTVTFSCSGGVFTNGDTLQIIKPNSGGIAYASLVDNKEEKVRITAKVLSYSVDTVVNFIAALPDDMLVTSNHYTGDTTTTFQITNSVVRNAGRGLVTDPVKVLFKVVSLDTLLNLICPDFAFTQNRQTTISISNPYQLKGRFNVESKTLSSQGDTLSKTLQIIIK
jgi:hypothetical protein